MKQPSIVLAGIDVSSAELVVALQRDGQTEPVRTVANSAAGHRQLIKLLTRGRARARVCLEATGVYSLRLALALHLQAAALKLALNDPDLANKLTRLCSTPGIGKITALRLLGELLVLPNDLKAHQWVAHAGLDPRPRQSGQHDAPRHISRTGNRHLRLALFMPALVAIQRSPQVQACYQAFLARGKKPKVAIVAIMRKLLHCLWGMLHHQRDFDPQLFHPLPTPHAVR